MPLYLAHPRKAVDVDPLASAPPEVNPTETVAVPAAVDAEVRSRVVRIPHFGHLLLLGALMTGALIMSGIGMVAALHFKLGGIATTEEMGKSIVYNLGFVLMLYGLTFGPAAAVFPMLWKKSLLAGLQWNGGTARAQWKPLMGVGVVLFSLVASVSPLFHLPVDAPIKALLKTPGAFWIMFAFGVTMAPFFEELIFRGFLLPAVCTACDWAGEKARKRAPEALGAGGHPHWSVTAMVVGTVVTSALFMAIHAPQIGLAAGPLAVLLGSGALLCVVRLRTRSVAASVLVHMTYNFSLFALSAVNQLVAHAK
jgi:CAAX protease family protein